MINTLLLSVNTDANSCMIDSLKSKYLVGKLERQLIQKRDELIKQLEKEIERGILRWPEITARLALQGIIYN